jgi:Tfp pilus assembly protein PilO
MARKNWLTIAGWIALLCCFLIAFFFGWSQWNRLQQTQANLKQVNQQQAYQNQQLQTLQNSYVPLALRIAVPDTVTEDARFVTELQALMSRANVRQLRLTRPPVRTLPPIESINKASAPGSVNERNAANDPNKQPDPSITNLPLGLRAIPLSVEVQGSYPDVRSFFGLVRNYRRDVRAININSFSITGADEKGLSKATLAITRFVRPDPLPIPGMPAETSSLPGTAPQSQTNAPQPAGDAANAAPNAGATTTAQTPPRR